MMKRACRLRSLPAFTGYSSFVRMLGNVKPTYYQARVRRKNRFARVPHACVPTEQGVLSGSTGRSPERRSTLAVDVTRGCEPPFCPRPVTGKVFIIYRPGNSGGPPRGDHPAQDRRAGVWQAARISHGRGQHRPQLCASIAQASGGALHAGWQRGFATY